MAALVWIGYGAVIRSFPLIAANVIVGFAAAYSSLRPNLDLQTHNCVKKQTRVVVVAGPQHHAFHEGAP